MLIVSELDYCISFGTSSLKALVSYEWSLAIIARFEHGCYSYSVCFRWDAFGVIMTASCSEGLVLAANLRTWILEVRTSETFLSLFPRCSFVLYRTLTKYFLAFLPQSRCVQMMFTTDLFHCQMCEPWCCSIVGWLFLWSLIIIKNYSCRNFRERAVCHR